jgi:cyclohexadienyl dehydratase
MARSRTPFLLIFLYLLPISLCNAQNPSSKLDDVLTRGTLRIGTTGDYKPFTYLDQAANQFEGFDIDLARSLGEALGVKVEFVKTSWPTLMQDFTEGKFDVAMGGISFTFDRAKKAYFSDPYIREGKTPIARCEKGGKFQTLAEIDRPEVRVIVNPGGTNERFARAHLTSAPIAVFADNAKIFDEIVQGRADVMITDASETRYQQKLHKELCAIHPDAPFDFSEKAYLLPRDEPLRLFVNEWLHTMRENGGFQAVQIKWFQ